MRMRIERKGLLLMFLMAFALAAVECSDFGSFGLTPSPKVPTAEAKAAEAKAETDKDQSRRWWASVVANGINFGALVIAALSFLHQIRERKKEVAELRKDFDHLTTQLRTILDVPLPPRQPDPEEKKTRGGCF